MSRIARLFIALSILAAGAASAAVITVPGDYAQINDAVQAAQPGDVVQVGVGTFGDCTHETEGPGSTPACVIMKTGVTLRGAGAGAGGTVIDAQGLGRGIFVDNVRDVRIEDLVVRNAFATAYGGGILLRNVDRSVEVVDVLVTACTDGGVICYDHASPLLERVDCVGNEAKQGGGLAIEENSHPWVIDCLIDGNAAPSGAGIFIRNGCEPYLSGCTISNNSINANYGQGAGVFIGDSNPTLIRCDISGNSSLGNGGGVAFQLGSTGTLIACTITDNTLDLDYVYGAGVAVDSSAPLLEGCVIAGNRCVAPQSDAAGVHALFSPSPTLLRCTIADNETTVAGGGAGVMAQWGSAPQIQECIIAFNLNGAGIYCDGATPTTWCSDVYGNEDDTICGTDGGTNISQNPQFCGAGDYRLQVASPCATVCGGVIGALPNDCGYTDAGDATRAAHLIGNYPNPFNPKTTIVFRLDEPGRADVRIVDVAGRTVATLTLGDLPAGRHEAVWNGDADDGRECASGVYFYELQALGTQHSRRMILLK